MTLLIVITWFGGQVNGPTISMQEISNMDRCTAAAQAIRDEAKVWLAADKFRAFCVLR